MRGRYAALLLLTLGAGLGAGVFLERDRASALRDAASDAGPEILYWVAPMDPNFRKDGPGKSPMGMDLVPVYDGDAPSGDPAEVRLSPAEINAIGVRTATARIEDISRRIDTVGFVTFDEHATSHIHTRVDGWIDRLAVRALGDRVAKGALLFDLYAPEIIIASSELMRATRREDADEISIARTKLRNFGVSPRQIDEMALADAPAERIRYYAPQDGVVIALDAADGMFLRPETRAMSLADLSSVWVMVDVFERDMGRLTPDMKAEARFDHLPGQVFTGTVEYIFPQLDPETRTLRARLRFDNTDGLFKPNMFARVSLLPAQARPALTVPSEAVIRTGRAERVVLRTAQGTFLPRLVTTGLRGAFGDTTRTEILQGLAPGDVVVASAQFLIDSESALNAGMLRFAATDAAPVSGKGVLVSLDPATARARIRHDDIDGLDWPAMETAFALRAGLALDRVAPGDTVRFSVARGADGLLALTTLGPDDGVDATGTGIVHAVTPDGKLTLSHDPIPALGWPAMRMDLDVQGVDTAAVPLDTPVEFDLAEDAGGLFTIVSLRPAPPSSMSPATPDTASPEAGGAAPPITVTGTIDSLSPDARRATVTHGPIAAIGMPGMTMEFALADGLDPATLPLGQPATLILSRLAGMTMILSAATPDTSSPEAGDAATPTAPPITVTGTIDSLSPDARRATITHGPIAAIGMPGMTMEFALADGLDPATLPLGRETGLLLEQGADFSLTLIGIAEEGAE